MKVKAYKLAVELGLSEQEVLDWLHKNGCPTVKSGDTIRADVANTARRVLKRQPAPPPELPKAAPKPIPQAQLHTDNPAIRTPQQIRKAAQKGGTFAELLEAHLPKLEGSLAPQRARTLTEEHLDRRLAEAEALKQSFRAEADAGIAKIAELQNTIASKNAEIASLKQELEDARSQKARADALYDETIELQLDRATLRRRVQAQKDELQTLEQTCAELQEALLQAKESAAQAEQSSQVKQLIDDLENATKREIAWRARALELERSNHTAQTLPSLLQSLGLTDPAQQLLLLASLFDDKTSGTALLRAIRQIDAAQVEQLVTQRLRKTCAHPICHSVTKRDELVPLRVDDDKECEVCHGDPDRRWFIRMVQECGWAGVKRLLIVGGDEDCQDKLRDLSQGQGVELRLVQADEPLQTARIAARVEGADVVVTWSRQTVDGAISDAYAQCAVSSGRLVVPVLGSGCTISELARAVCNRLARNHVMLSK